jgi:hypothetical protein
MRDKQAKSRDQLIRQVRGGMGELGEGAGELPPVRLKVQPLDNLSPLSPLTFSLIASSNPVQAAYFLTAKLTSQLSQDLVY